MKRPHHGQYLHPFIHSSHGSCLLFFNFLCIFLDFSINNSWASFAVLIKRKEVSEDGMRRILYWAKKEGMTKKDTSIVLVVEIEFLRS